MSSSSVESSAKGTPGRPALPSFVVQKHWATHLHYDLRLEVEGRLVSWALPKGPSLDPQVHRMALRTADHELDYGRFEGVLPSGEYGAGTVMVWDLGTFEPLRPAGTGPQTWLERGVLKFLLHGERLSGLWRMVRVGPKGPSPSPERWLLVKVHDHHAVPGWDIEREPRSALTGRTREEIARRAPSVRRPTLDLWGLDCAGEGPQDEDRDLTE